MERAWRDYGILEKWAGRREGGHFILPGSRRTIG
jgi:hypothetical protein